MRGFVIATGRRAVLVHPMQSGLIMNGQTHLKELAAALECDREALDALFEKARWLPVTNMFSAFHTFVDQHVAAEERAVDGLVSDGLCSAELATRIAEAHRLMKGLVEDAKRAMRRDDAEAFACAFGHLVRLTAAHERRETEEVLPALCARTPLTPGSS